MSQPYYPNLNLGALASLMTLRQQMEVHPNYLTLPECPYEEDTVEQIERIMAPQIIEKEVIVEREVIVEKRIEVAAKAADGGGKRGPKQKSPGVDVDAVAQEIQDIRQELKQLKIDGKALQTADKIQIIKTRATLVEKLISMNEKVTNQRQMSLFMSTVMTILDDLVEEEGRQEFMRRLETYAT